MWRVLALRLALKPWLRGNIRERLLHQLKYDVRAALDPNDPLITSLSKPWCPSRERRKHTSAPLKAACGLPAVNGAIVRTHEKTRLAFAHS